MFPIWNLPAGFQIWVYHVKGKSNAVADAFSRIQINATSCTAIDFTAMAQAQVNNSATQDLKVSNTSLQFVDVPLQGHDNLTLLCDVSQGQPRPVVPASLWREAFHSIYDLTHHGANSTSKLVREHFVWNGLNRDVCQLTWTCIPCQQSKIYRHTAAPIQRFELPNRRFDAVHVDLVGPLPLPFTCMDRYSRWMEAIPLTSITAEACARVLLEGWIERFSLPTSIIFDHSRQFQPLSFPASSGNQAQSHHRLPPTSQWDCRTFSPPAEDGIESAPRGTQLVGGIPDRHAGDPNRP